MVELLSTKGRLRAGLTVDSATDVLLVVFGDSTYHLLTHDRGWSHDDVVTWFAYVAPYPPPGRRGLRRLERRATDVGEGLGSTDHDESASLCGSRCSPTRSPRTRARRGRSVARAGRGVGRRGLHRRLGRASVTRTCPDEGNGGYQVRRYDLDVRFNPDTDRLAGRCDHRGHGDAVAVGVQPRPLRPRRRLRHRRRCGRQCEPRPPRDDASQPAVGHHRGRAFTVVVTYAGKPEILNDPDLGKSGWFNTARRCDRRRRARGRDVLVPGQRAPQRQGHASATTIAVPKGLQAVSNGLPARAADHPQRVDDLSLVHPRPDGLLPGDGRRSVGGAFDRIAIRARGARAELRRPQPAEER